MRKEDFEFKEVDLTDGHIDYWFWVKGETKQELSHKYGGEQAYIGVTRVLYSKDEDIVGIRRQFHCSHDVVLSDDDTLRDMLKSIVGELDT